MKQRELDRRTFAGTLGGAAVLAMTSKAAIPTMGTWLDCNVTLGQWPFRTTPLQSAAQLSKKLHEQGVTQAWAGSFEAIFQNDVQAVNLQLARVCREAPHKNLFPVATINPSLPDWQSDLVHAHEQLSMSIIRLYPNYHSYKLDDACFEDFLNLAVKRQLAIQVVVQIEDDRTQSPRMQVPPVDLKPLAKQLHHVPTAKVMILNASRPQLDAIIPSESILFDIAKIEGICALEQILETVNHERMVFGSHAPFFYWEAARLKLQESELLDRQLDAIVQGNATRWLNA